jgi:hypothetical protein
MIHLNRKMLPVILVLVLFSFKSNNFEYRKLNNNAFVAGESIEFRLHYGFVTAGYGTVRILPYTEKLNGRDVFHVIGKGRSVSTFDWFFKVRDEYHSYIDMAAITPLKFTKDIHEGGYTDDDNASFDNEKKMVTSTKGNISMPEYTQDIISMLYYARSLDIRNAAIGATFPLTFYLDKEITTISLKIIGRETISTELGKFRTIKIRPQVIAERVFKDKDAVTLWVSDDANLLPLRLQADLAVGSIKADIIKCSNLKNNQDALIIE